MEKISQLMSYATAGFAALVLSVLTISATVSPINLAAPPVATQGMVA